ncbi:MAG: helix-turn-helix transcriptional regulator [Nitrospirae bacterium]|nr:helix-turn-helix transcriptional regulator [Nitrospirota bacterium]
MQEYVHTGIVRIIMKGLSGRSAKADRKRDEILALIKDHPEFFPAEKKTELLSAVLSADGPDMLFGLAEGRDHGTDFPLIYVLLNSGSPATVIRKLESYYQYCHSSKRVQLVSGGENHLLIRHVSAAKQPISAAEDFFVCGMLQGLLRLAGCRHLTYRWQKVSDPKAFFYMDRYAKRNVEVAPFSQWRFTFEEFQRPAVIEGLDGFIMQSVSPLYPRPSSDTMSEIVESIIRQDLSRKWTLPDIAARLRMSPRTLQRRLQGEGRSFRNILNRLRVRRAEKLLIESDFSLTEIGFMLGFSDYAHFSREIKRIKGMNPLSYRMKHLRQTVLPKGRAS